MSALTCCSRVLIVLVACSAVGLGAAVGDSSHQLSSANQSADHGGGSATRAKRLTTFGKSANMPSPAPPLSALRTPCNSDNECLEGAECVINPNATVNINQRMCYCMPGWLEVEGYCNGSSINSASILLALIFSVLVATFSQI